jgi:ParB family chromosome partitioning protein
MALGNKGFAGLVVGGGEGVVETRRPPRTGFLGARENRLAELAEGGMVTRVHEAVDPAICRIWGGHNRDYAALNEHICADLLDSLRAQGRQEVPAIVRRVKGDAAYQFEVVCGARRHWSVSWLRAHDYPDFKFVVEPRELSDEEAFRIADLENRSRKDLSDYERAIDYARAIERYYDGSQQRMADRLRVSKSWLSRYLELAKLPPEILGCFDSPHAIGISHAAALAPVLGRPRERDVVLEEASALCAELQSRRQQGIPALPSAQVVARLLSAGAKRPKPSVRSWEIRDEDGRLLLKARLESERGLVFSVSKNRIRDRAQVLQAVDQCLQEFAATDDKGTLGPLQRRQPRKVTAKEL